jgi:hypothetical protein
MRWSSLGMAVDDDESDGSEDEDSEDEWMKENIPNAI